MVTLYKHPERYLWGAGVITDVCLSDGRQVLHEGQGVSALDTAYASHKGLKRTLNLEHMAAVQG